MDNLNQENISYEEFKEGKDLNEYILLIQKLKEVKEIINVLEKKFLEKEI